MPTGTQNRQRVPRCTIGRLPASGSCTLSIVRKPGAPPRAYTLPGIRQTDIRISQRLHLQPTVRTGVICQPHSDPHSADRFRVSNYIADFSLGRNKVRRPARPDLWQVRRGSRLSPSGVRRNPSAWAVPRIWL
jgi:hypothetical protein